jgi:hypothetical protein
MKMESRKQQLLEAAVFHNQIGEGIIGYVNRNTNDKFLKIITKE